VSSKGKFFLEYSNTSLSKARKLRREMTEAERKLWSLLRAHRLGLHFRRQAPIGPYVVDFLCLEAKLVLELDGGQHYEKEGITKDVKRDAYLAGQGLTVLRFSNREFLTNPEGALQLIDEHIRNYRKDPS